MYINILILLILMKNCLSTTLIKNYPTVNLTENCKINTNVIKLINDEEINKIKLILLNLSGFERNLFEIINESIYTINEIDREKLLIEKRCFDRLYCLIEIHILVNDGQQYWIIPIHIIDENDNKPEFKNSLIELKFDENIKGGYKIPFEGALDKDEGINGNIHYFLDCSLIKLNETLTNCYPLFQLIILSKSLINQYDQLAIKYNPSSSSLLLLNEYKLKLFAFNININGKKELINSILINIFIENILKEPKFDLVEYKFIIKIKSFLLKKNEILGKINAKSNDLKKRISYKIKNETNLIKINSLTGELYLLNDTNILSIKNEIHLLIEGFYLINNKIKSFTNIYLYFRSINYLNNISFNYHIQSSFIYQLNKNSNEFFIYENISSFQNEILFKLTIFSFYYPNDKFILLLENNHSIFSLSSSSLNNYFLTIHQSFLLKSIYLLTIRIKHQLTDEYLSNIIIQFNKSFIQSSIICLQNSTYFLYYLNKTNFIGKFQVIQTNLNISSFTKFQILFNKNLIFIDQCQMFIEELNHFYLNETYYKLCSSYNYCYNITQLSININSLFSKAFFLFKPIEIIIFILFIVFIISIIIFIFIIYRLKAFHFCLTIKNYLFYGKKYGLSHAQRLSSAKMTQRVHSIVVRESQSPSIKPYVFNIDQFIQQEPIPSPHIPTSSIQPTEITISNLDNRSSSFIQETKQVLDISSNQDFDLSRLASEV